jgi:hypothetical protein
MDQWIKICIQYKTIILITTKKKALHYSALEASNLKSNSPELYSGKWLDWFFASITVIFHCHSLKTLLEHYIFLAQ